MYRAPLRWWCFLGVDGGDGGGCECLMVVLGGGCEWLLLVVVPTFTATLTLTPFLPLYTSTPMCCVYNFTHISKH